MSKSEDPPFQACAAPLVVIAEGRASNLPALDAMTLAAASNASRRTVRTRLDWIAHCLGFDAAAAVPWESLTPVHTAWVAARAIDSCAPDTARAILSALRALALQGWRIGVWSHDEHARLVDLPAVRGTRLPRGRTLSALDVEQLAAVAGDGAIGDRDRAALALLVGCGLRRDECVRLDCADVGEVLRVRGKGDKQRAVPVVAWGRRLLDRWRSVRGGEPGPLLCHVARHGTVLPGARLTGTGLYVAMGKLTERSGIALWSPHDGRRTFASALLDATGDLDATAQVLGHASTDTTPEL